MILWSPCLLYSTDSLAECTPCSSRAPEILFKPELIGRDHYGMHESIYRSILSTDIDLRRCFLGNIVLSGNIWFLVRCCTTIWSTMVFQILLPFVLSSLPEGGNTLLPGLPERLQDEIKGLLPSDMGGSVCVTSPKDRDSSVWRGGAVLANMPTFTSAWISQDEYEEYGPQIVFRKCFWIDWKVDGSFHQQCCWASGTQLLSLSVESFVFFLIFSPLFFSGGFLLTPYALPIQPTNTAIRKLIKTFQSLLLSLLSL